MADKSLKSKFRLGQMVWYIANGYVANSTIKAILVTQHDEVVYSTDVPYYRYSKEDECRYEINYDNILSEENLFLSRKALVNHISKQEDDE